MPRLPAKLAKIFGGGLAAPDNIAKFGTTKLGAPAFSLDPDQIQTAAWVSAWAAAVLDNGSPVMQDRNAIDFVVTYMLALIQQDGVCAWVSTKTYYTGSWVQAGAAGMLYRSKTDANTAHDPTTDSNNWQTIVDFLLASGILNTKQLLKRWCSFNGQGGVGFYDQFGFSGIARPGVGNYMLTFNGDMPFENYGWTAGLTQENAVDALVQCTRFPGDTKTVTQFQIRTVSCFDSSPRDCPEVNLSFFDAS
jgi:hypothetical protein